MDKIAVPIRNKCPRCQSEKGYIVPHTGKHKAKLVCLSCDRWLKWLNGLDIELSEDKVLEEKKKEGL